MSTQTGIIKSFNNSTGKGGGYGFIGRQGMADMFVHINEVIGAKEKDRPELYPGDQVSFDIGKDRRDRPIAKNVRVQLRAEKTDAHRAPQHLRD